MKEKFEEKISKGKEWFSKNKKDLLSGVLSIGCGCVVGYVIDEFVVKGDLKNLKKAFGPYEPFSDFNDGNLIIAFIKKNDISLETLKAICEKNKLELLDAQTVFEKTVE